MLVAGAAALLVGSALTLSRHVDDYRTVAGEGHGRGMSQVGAFDGALDGWNADRILDHYYPGATRATIPAVPIRVRLDDQNDSTLDTYADAGAFVADRELEPGQVAHLTPLPDGGANVVVTAGCDGAEVWQETTEDPWVRPVDPGVARPAAEHLHLCGGRAYRGALGVALEDSEARTVNEVGIEDYLLGVVPAEVQANWADKGAAEALRAQAIAARSYALAEDRYPYAQTCDSTDCQMYPGTEKEDPRAADAVATTAGTVLLRDGRVLRSEYSSAPDGGHPADINTFEVGPSPEELGALAPAPAEPENPDIPVDPTEVGAAPEGESAIDAEYRRIGGPDSAIGAATGPEMDLPQGAGTYRRYDNGVIIVTPVLGARVVNYTEMLQLIPDSSQRDDGGSDGSTTSDPIKPGPQEPGAPELVGPSADVVVPEASAPVAPEPGGP
ncbi:SpoIID/LytB domain-containing protein [Nocardia callitridis]|uniref:Sporulation stage II protein D amidase enhancer LytB N-terminal domain-containing protein n=1 Tax=Nocardia callitridis TaxID=648753 RepID=A0ABP9JXX0_9NOCA